MLWDERFAAYGEPITHDFEQDVALWKGMRADWLAQNRRLAGNASIAELSNVDGSRRIYIHQTSNSGPKQWQLSEISNGRALGHDIFPTFDAALEAASGGEVGSPGVYKVVTTR